MSGETRQYFAVGGTMKSDAPSYLERAADRLVFESLIAGELCYILDSRQKGKSSIIVRSIDRLRSVGITTVKIDLQRFGSNINCEQWYSGLLYAVGQEFDLIEPMFEYWGVHLEIGPMARWFGCIENVVLEGITGPIVIFIDEVDYLLSLPFSVDEFFAGMRECYNRRSTEIKFDRLTFFLAGVASPNQLIANEDVTPFNIGVRVHLADFTRTDIQPFAAPLSASHRDANAVLDRIFWWTHGHPYLTQLIASNCSGDATINCARDVDRLVQSLLFEPEAKQRETHIADSERRLLEAKTKNSTPTETRSQMLDVYRLLLHGEIVKSNFDPDVIEALLLSGVCATEGSKLRIRNRIYATIFDESWRRNNLPIQEAQRQRAAAIRSAWFIGRIAIAVLVPFCLVLAYLLVVTNQRNSAIRSVNQLNAKNQHLAYQASIALASESADDSNYLKAFDMVKAQRDSPDKGWEWNFWNARFSEPTLIKPPDPDVEASHLAGRAWIEDGKLIHVTRLGFVVGDLVVHPIMKAQNGGYMADWVRATAGTAPLESRLKFAFSEFSDNPDTYVNISEDKRFKVKWSHSRTGFDIVERATGNVSHIETPFAPVGCYFSHSGNMIVAASIDNYSHMYNIEAKRWQWRQRLAQIAQPVFSPDDKLIVLLQVSPEVTILRTDDGTLVSRLGGASGTVMDAHWFSDNSHLITSSSDGSAKIWTASTGTLERLYLGAGADTWSVDLSPDEREIIAATRTSSVHRWHVDSRPFIERFDLHSGKITSMRMSPNGSRIVTNSVDGVSVLFDVTNAKVVGRFDLGHDMTAHPMAFSIDGAKLFLVATDGRILIVDSRTGEELRRVAIAGKTPISIGSGPNGEIIFGVRGGGIFTMEDANSTPSYRSISGLEVTRIAFSPDNRFAAFVCTGSKLGIFDSATERIAIRDVGHIRLIDAEFSPDSQWLSASSQDRKAYLISMNAHVHDKTLVGHLDRVWGAHFSPDSRYVLTNSYDNTARVWRVETGAQISLMQHGSWVSSAHWSPDGRRVVTAAADNLARVFDPTDGFELMKLGGHHDIVFDALFTPDGETVITDCGDGAVRMWRTKQ